MVSLDSRVRQASKDLRDYLAQLVPLGQQAEKVRRVRVDRWVYLERLDRLVQKVTKEAKVGLVLSVQWVSQAHKDSGVQLVL